jgi:hypothetical protein
LRRWIERKSRKQAEVRAKIRRLVDAQIGISRPDFDLKVTNCWRFSSKTQAREFDGGICPDLVANLLHYYSDPGGRVLDPMAGGRTTRHVLDRFRYFKAAVPGMPHSGPRDLVEADISPAAPDVIEADVRVISEHVPAGVFDLVILDPPYWRVADGKYDTFGETAAEWGENMRAALASVAVVLAPSGRVAVITDDYLRASGCHPLGLYVMRAADAVGLVACGTVYNPFPNAVVSMGPIEMARAKEARLQVNGVKVIQLFARGQLDPA